MLKVLHMESAPKQIEIVCINVFFYVYSASIFTFCVRNIVKKSVTQTLRQYKLSITTCDLYTALYIRVRIVYTSIQCVHYLKGNS